MKKKSLLGYKLLFLLFFVCSYSSLLAQVTYFNPQTDKKLLRDFENRKLGLFVHWMACFTPETGDSWGIGNPTPKHVADSISYAFNPSNFNAKEMVATAKRLGCKYMVVISKHHDGFAIWPTRYADFNITKSAYKGPDILASLGKECKAQGLLFGIYYSIADIDYCGWTKMAEARVPITMPVKGKEDFIQFNKNQVKELITDYNPDILWFDGYWLDPDLWTPKEGKDLYQYIKSLKPQTLSTRLSVTFNPKNPKKEGFVNDGSAGDFFAVEAKHIQKPDFPWEGCTSVSYPVYAYDPNAKLKTPEELVEMFDNTICNNGNFLLNIGPDTKGELPQPLVDRFNDLSKWIKPYTKAIYNTRGGPFTPGKWGGSTHNNKNIYLHLNQKEDKKTIVIKKDALKGYELLGVNDLLTKKPLSFKKTAEGYTVQLPEGKAEYFRIIELTLNKQYMFTSWIDL